MADPAVLKALSRETKALILVSEFEARRMPMFQLRGVLETIVRDDEERKTIIDMIENDLRATGYPQEQIAAFLSDLCMQGPPKVQPIDPQISATRKLKSPFSMGFDSPASGSVSRPPSGTLPAVPAKPPSGFLNAIPAKPPSSGTLASIPPKPASGIRSAIPSDLPPPDSLPPPDFGPAPSSALPLTTTPTGLPPPPKPPERGRASASGQRRSTMMFEATPPPAAPANAGFIPAGDKTTSRHTLMFGGLAGATPPTAAPATPASSAVPAAPLTAKRGETILLADDDKRARMVFRMRLEEAGFTTIEVGTGTEAWDRIQQGGLAAAVLDMKMPGLHGLEVLSHVADKQLGLPIVICTAYDQLEDEFVVQTYPKLKYLVKPIAPETLVNALKELIAKP